MMFNILDGLECNQFEGFIPDFRIDTHSKAENELKFILSPHHMSAALSWISHACRPDPVHPRGIVSSIYFDTRELACLREKVNSDYLKTKFRVRWYRDPETGEWGSQSFAEIKFRIGYLRTKRRLPTSYTGERLAALDLEDHKIDRLASLFRSMGVLSYPALVPTLLIQYERHRFVERSTGARVCLDRHVQVPKLNRRIVPRTGPFTLLPAVVEVKGAGPEVPGSLRRLSLIGCSRSSFSKYSGCYRRVVSLQGG